MTCTGTNQPAFIAGAGVTGLTVTNTAGSSITGVAVTAAGTNAQRSSVRINGDSTFTNNGSVNPALLANSQRDYVGVNLNGTNATLVNNGDITVTNNATLAGSGTYRLYGVITSNDSGAPEFENVTVRNFGSIAVTQSGAGIARGVYAGEDIDSLKVENFGTMTATRIGNATSTQAVGVVDSDDDVEEVGVINHAGATMSSTGANTYTIQGRAGEYEIRNDGTIDHSGTGAAILIWRGTNTGPSMAEVENTATGVINGDIYLVDRNPNTGNVVTNGFARDSEIENAGRINGSVFLGRGMHTLENEGTITGNITVDQVGSATAATAFTRPDIQGRVTFGLTNTGTIGGNLTINDVATSVNTVNLVTGSSIGNITATNGVGNNALILSAPGTGGGGDDDDDDAPAGGTTFGTLNSNVSGFRTLTQTGGIWTLAAGTTQTFSQGAQVVGGTLYVDSTLNAATTVGEDGTLGGNGLINGNVTNFGLVSPGSNGTPYGTLTVAGTYRQDDDARLSINGNAAGTNAKLQVNGVANLAGDVHLQAASGTYAPGTTYAVLNATGGFNNSRFDTVSSSGLPTLLAAVDSYDANNVYLTLEQQSFALVARTPNQVAVAAGVDALLAGNTAALTYLDNQSDRTLSGILDRLAGQGYASVADAQFRSGRLFTDAMMGRAYAGVFESGPTGFTLPPATYAADLPNRGPVPEPRFVPTSRGYGVWATGYGQTGQISTTATTAGRNETLAGFAAGVDMHPSAGSFLGIAAGYGSVDVNLSQLGERAHTDNAQVGLYGGVSNGPLYATAAVGYAHTDGRLNRSLAGLQILQPNGANGQLSGNQFLSAGEAGYRYVYAKDQAITPFVGFQVSTFSQDRVTEAGAGLFNLNVAAQDFLSARSQVGGRLEHFADVGGTPVTFAIKGAYVHDFADVSRTIQSSFALVPAVPFTVEGRRLGRDRALVGVGLGAVFAPGWTGFINYDAEVAVSDTIQSGRAGARYSF